MTVIIILGGVYVLLLIGYGMMKVANKPIPREKAMKTYTIKPLEWEDFAHKHQLQSSNTKALMGRYFVFENNYGGWRWQFGIERVTLVDTMAEGKSAAEAHYIQQMEKRLEVTP